VRIPFPRDYWASYEREIPSLLDYFDAVRKISAYQKATESRFVWRGVVDADWGLHSSLVRRYRDTNGGQVPDERHLRDFELEVIGEAQDWGLDWHAAGGRLAALELLAALQHYGIPTRLLDFSFNPFIALWFAVEKDDGSDGRVFAIDIAEQEISRENAAKADPWWLDESANTTAAWSTRPWIWKPPPFEPRIVRQEGCFLMGGVPSTQPARNTRIPEKRPLNADEIRTCMSVPLVLIKHSQAEAAYDEEALVGHPPKARAFTLRITASKDELRDELDRTLGHGHRSLFPDFPGLAQYGRSFAT
jgi:FRG domain